MGLINNDSLDTSYGSSITGTYMAIAEHDIRVANNADAAGYILSYSAGIWINEAARTADKRIIKTISGSVNLTDDQLTGSIYTIAYNAIKGKYPNTTDV